ncbi:hypothetical protein KY289_001384 [Solanum tuberosum]|nr:hypothetical protein KY289_001384 [Solanum tuberosum]
MASFPFQLSIIDRTCSRWFSFLLLNVTYPALKAKNLRTTENEKLEANALYLNGLAETWYHSLVLSSGVVTWTEFKEELCDRFDTEQRNNHLFLDRPGHQCKMKQLNCQIGELEPNQCTLRQPYEGKHYFGQGTVKNRNMAILIDSGSTYKFIDEGNVKETGHKVSYCPLVKVTVADRNYVMCTSHCQEFSWKMKDIPN